MIQARATDSSALIEASPRAVATCPMCNMRVRARCGPINAWHWSHISLDDCDTFSDGETEWHLGWKNPISKNRREVIMQNHRADIIGNGGTVVELQNSSISLSELTEREKFYGENMIWLVNATPSKKAGYGIRVLDGGDFTWRNQTFRFSQRKVFFDCGSFIFEVTKFSDSFYFSTSGKGRKLVVERFIQSFLSEAMAEPPNYDEQELSRKEQELFVADVDPICYEKKRIREEQRRLREYYKMYRDRNVERMQAVEKDIVHRYCLTCKTQFPDSKTAMQHILSTYDHQVRVG